MYAFGWVWCGVSGGAFETGLVGEGEWYIVFEMHCISLECIRGS